MKKIICMLTLLAVVFAIQNNANAQGYYLPQYHRRPVIAYVTPPPYCPPPVVVYQGQSRLVYVQPHYNNYSYGYSHYNHRGGRHCR